MEHMAADLHSNNGYYGIIEPDGKRVYQKRLPLIPSYTTHLQRMLLSYLFSNFLRVLPQSTAA